jgi:hypothetical protein
MIASGRPPFDATATSMVLALISLMFSGLQPIDSANCISGQNARLRPVKPFHAD